MWNKRQRDLIKKDKTCWINYLKIAITCIKITLLELQDVWDTKGFSQTFVLSHYFTST